MRTLLMPTPLHLALVLSASLFAASCHHQTKQDAPPTSAAQDSAPAASQDSPAAPAPASSGDKTCSSDNECAAKQLCIRNRCTDITPDLAECSSVRIHFDFNATEIHAGDKPLLDRMSRCLKADHALHVTVEGNADERGTQEYNLALGDRRATEVARYLELLGVSQAQLKTVSYGKENPLCTEHDEACWANNRRAALKPSESKR